MNKIELKQIIKEELEKILKEEAEDIAANKASDEIAKKFKDLVKAQDLVINKIDTLKKKRDGALIFYKEVKMDPARVGAAVQALKDIQEEIKEWQDKLTSIQLSYDKAIASSTEALDAKKSPTGKDTSEEEEEAVESELADEVIF